ncbi:MULTISPECIES: MarR family winged helix-turn-helix transcriptional regulator [Symbiopectobacterium]|uniref:MarR family winged helix-turn-helix transcriptional regulator n=1 Tax=Symbiopectobacterium TaxID=801 RepID=UPI001A257884|nr:MULTISPECIES: MarR family transcriptional regulator [Symbiopectobacterium]MBG6248229.1 MarR family transcriptional regulator [Candidatus Symbiopectobacterium sp. PLON1]MBT9430879.1 MarR family transcriptional regulator [Candidatus Symbiopectobacterium endolongispinus]
MNKKTQTVPTSLPAQAYQLDGQPCSALYSANLAMNKVYRKQLAALSLTYPQYLVMLVLWERDGITVSELCEQLYLDSATLTPLPKRLQQSGLVSRTRSAEYERQVLIRLTEEDRTLQQKASAIPENMRCATQCDDSTLQAMKQQLEYLRARLIENL